MTQKCAQILRLQTGRIHRKSHGLAEAQKYVKTRSELTNDEQMTCTSGKSMNKKNVLAPFVIDRFIPRIRKRSAQINEAF